jgi:hypothetical protein
MRKDTGRTQGEWNAVVKNMMSDDHCWSWKVEVKPKESTKGFGLMGVYALDTRDSKPVFRENEIIGPLAGRIRRRQVYEKMFYPCRSWLIHDPFAHEFGAQLRAQTTELKTEPLVIDFLSGSQNRLRYLSDVRVDPLALQSLLPDPAATCHPRPAETTRRAMRRPRSRGSSPVAQSPEDELSEIPPSPSAASVAPESRAPSEATAKIVEVLVDGWPYAFVVAQRDIAPGEEVTVDHGENRWQTHRVALARLLEVGRLGKELAVGVVATNAPVTVEGAPLQFPRRSMRRPA